MTDVWESEGGAVLPPWKFYHNDAELPHNDHIRIDPATETVWLQGDDDDGWTGVSFKLVHELSQYLHDGRYDDDARRQS